MKANKGSGGLAPNILNLRTIGSSVSLMLQPVYHQTKVHPPPQYPLTRRLGRSPRASLDVAEKTETSCCCQDLNPQTVRPIA